MIISFAVGENPSPGFSKTIHDVVAVLDVVYSEVAVVAGELCPRVDMETDHFVVHFRMSEQGRLTMNFAALHSTDTVTAKLTVKLVLILVCIFGCLCEVGCVFLFLPFRTQVAVCTVVSLFRIARDLRLIGCLFPGSTFFHFRFLFPVR